jgi:hypothetical protein
MAIGVDVCCVFALSDYRIHYLKQY